ncbi:Protein T24C12.4 [Aphelenchoides avenae]|nr:Protein T24C12.4 [Aphelenchus avenae]
MPSVNSTVLLLSLGIYAIFDLSSAQRRFHSKYENIGDPRYLKRKPTKDLVTVSASPPCCGDVIGALACKRLKQGNPGNFERRCEFDPDFSLVQCCHSCGVEKASERHYRFFYEGEASRNCFDRHGRNFCEKFIEKTDFWSPTPWSCSGDKSHLAFRICRKTCGFCQRDLYYGPGGVRYSPAPWNSE